MLDGLKSRVVIPIMPLEKSKTPSANLYPQNLCPVIEIGPKKYVVMTHQITSISVRMLKSEEGLLLKYKDEIVAAIDFLITGI
jgi:toxin CcdB